jgi:hypothetical protein
MSVQKQKPWIKSFQGWSWVVTIAWMVIANRWRPFGLFGLACMLTPVMIALCGRGKMHCARVCPRGSFIGLVTRRVSLGLRKPAFMRTKAFRWTLWGAMMGGFFAMVVVTVITVRQDFVAVLGWRILVFMESATALALLFGVLFTPRAWCTVCPMGFTTGSIRDLMEKHGG